MSQRVRPEDDFYETPEEATIALLERETFEGDIWEPAAGKEAIVKVLCEYGHYKNIFSTDLINRGQRNGTMDFLNPKHTNQFKGDCNNIITNPPFRLAQQFVERALELATDKVAMFLRLAFLESQSRKQMFLNTPLKAVYVFSKRLTIYPGDYKEENKKGSGTMAFAWFVWDHSHKSEPVIRWI